METSELMAEGVNQMNRRGPMMHRGRRASLDLDVRAAAASNVCVLFTSAGAAPAKQMAQRIHQLGRGRPGRFTAVDCGSHEALLEQQLFDVLRPGSGGTVFLEEVGRLSPELQERLVDALGVASGSRAPTRPRVMASTSEPLLQRALEGTFNERLFYRLNTIHLILPPDLGDA